MGKKRIPQQTQAEVLKETEAIESAMKKTEETAKSAKTPAIRAGQAHIQATFNNTIITIADDKGNTLAWSSSGALGFKGVKKATPFAASKVAEAVAEKVRKYNLTEIFVFVKGVGSGRESAIRSLANHGLNVVSIKDITGVPHNGCRPPKVRRV